MSMNWDLKQFLDKGKLFVLQYLRNKRQNLRINSVPKFNNSLLL